jgi:hypothetical protein
MNRMLVFSGAAARDFAAFDRATNEASRDRHGRRDNFRAAPAQLGAANLVCDIARDFAG